MEVTKLPDGWRLAKLGEIVKIGSRNVDPSVEPERFWNYVALENVEQATGRLVGFAPTRGKEIGSTKARFQEGDVLYGKLRPYLRKAWVAEFAGCSSTDLIPLTPTDGILAEYLKWFLLSPRHTEYIMPLMAGIRMPRLRSDDLFNMPIPLPPIHEQRRIVTCVEEMMERSRRARCALTTAQADGNSLLSRLNEEAYTAALEESTGVVAFGSVLEDIRGGTTLVPNDQESEVSVLRSSAVRPRMVDLTDVRYLTGADDLSSHHLLREGDLLITRLSGSLEYVGNMAVVKGLGDRRIAYPDRLFRARLQPSHVGEFYAILFASPSIRKQLEPSAKSTAGHQRISISNVKELKVPLCDQATQSRIATRTQEQLGELTSLKERTTLALRSLDTLERGLLADAFSGPR